MLDFESSGIGLKCPSGPWARRADETGLSFDCPVAQNVEEAADIVEDGDVPVKHVKRSTHQKATRLANKGQVEGGPEEWCRQEG